MTIEGLSLLTWRLRPDHRPSVITGSPAYAGDDNRGRDRARAKKRPGVTAVTSCLGRAPYRVARVVVETWEILMHMRSKELRAQAEECRNIAGRVGGLIKRQYEELARQWSELAERLERHGGTISRAAA